MLCWVNWVHDGAGFVRCKFEDLEIDDFIEVDICQVEVDRGQGIEFGYHGEMKLCWKA